MRCTLLGALLVVLPLSSCIEDVPGGSPGARISVAVAALDLPAVGDVLWDLEVANGAGHVVWQRRVTSSGYGDGAGSASYLGPCDADAGVAENAVRVWVVGVYADPVAAADAGSFAAGATTGAGAVTGGTPLDFESPTAAAALSRTFTCRPNADVAVRFDVTLLRPAAQGFFDIAISFNDLFCSAKYDCCYDTGDGVCDGAEDILLLFDADGARGRTHVLGFACTAGTENDALTRLYMNDLAIDCSAPYTPPLAADLTIAVGGATVGNLCTAGDMASCGAVTAADGVDADARLFQVAVYRGAEDLTSDGVSARKLYWNVALGVNDLSGCRLLTGATADDHGDALDGLAAGVLADGAVYPYVQWDVNLATCASEALTFGGAAGMVLPSYATGTGDGASFASFYDAANGAGAACSGGTCGCLVGYPGIPCTPSGPAPAPLALSPLAPAVSFGGTTAFTATGGAGGYVFSVTSGAGTIDPVTGLYTAPAGVDDSVVRVTDAAGAFVETTISACADRTINANTTLPAGDYCYGTLTVNSPAVLTLDGAGVGVRVGHVAIAGGASTTVGAGAALNLTTLSLAGTLTNQGTLYAGTTLTLSGSGSYWHGATGALSADTAALTVPSGTPAWSVSWANPVVPRVASLTVAAGATLTHAINTDTFANTGVYERSLRLETVGDATVLGAIDVSGKGYAAGKGPAPGVGYLYGNAAGGGGGYGGAGGQAGGTAFCGTRAGGAAYGDPLAPSGLGSGGGTIDTYYLGGAGGGEVLLVAGGTLALTGAIRANGGAGTFANGQYNQTASGGGAGGTVRVDAGAFTGAGAIEARGGSGGEGINCKGGAGGGGRIALSAETSGFTGSYDVVAGAGVQAGGPGTRVLAYAGGYDLWNVALAISGAQSWSTLTVASNASVTVQATGALTLDALQLNGVATNSGTLAVASTFTLAGGGRYVHTATAVLQADTAALTVPSGTGTWDVAPGVGALPRVGSATVPAGATLTHTANGATHLYSLMLETVGDLDLQGQINVSQRGYAAAAGGAAAGGTGTCDGCPGSGAGHGGGGGRAWYQYSPNYILGGVAQGAAGSPSLPGGGGGNAYQNTYFGGAGGGVVRLVVGGTLQLDGAISADGGSRTVSSNTRASGGGAGGSVWIDAADLAGAGPIYARGGSVRATLQGREAGAGGGGRIAVTAGTSSYTGARSAAAGVAYNSAGTAAVGASFQGVAGTVIGP